MSKKIKIEEINSHEKILETVFFIQIDKQKFIIKMIMIGLMGWIICS